MPAKYEIIKAGDFVLARLQDTYIHSADKWLSHLSAPRILQEIGGTYKVQILVGHSLPSLCALSSTLEPCYTTFCCHILIKILSPSTGMWDFYPGGSGNFWILLCSLQPSLALREPTHTLFTVTFDILLLRRSSPAFIWSIVCQNPGRLGDSRS